jgi:hypothetical protein
MVFAVGARRSGTYWLQRVLTTHPQIAGVPSETHLFSHGIAPLFDRFQHSLRSSGQVGAVYVEREVALDAARDLCDAIFGGLVDPDARYLCERTPVHALHLELISAIYPDARYIHIIRDGREVARSLLVQDFGPDTVTEAAAEWREAVSSARVATLPPERYREVRYERLAADPEPELRDLYRWLELDPSADAIEAGLAEAGVSRNVDQASQGGVGTQRWRRDFDRGDLEAFNREAGTLLTELGYEAADPAEMPRRRRAPRRVAPPARRLARSPIGALARRRRRASIDHRRRRAGSQNVVDRLIAALREGDGDALERALDPQALVRVIDGTGSERSARGPEALELARKRLLADEAFGARQIRGDVFPALPHFGMVLTVASAQGAPRHRVLFCELRGDLIRSLTVYQLD